MLLAVQIGSEIWRMAKLVGPRKRKFARRNKTPDAIGERYERFVIIGEAPPYVQPSTGARQRQWLCRCDCGTIKIVPQRGLRDGTTKSCGCYGKERSKNQIVHGHARSRGGDKPTPTFNAWRTMLQRCTNPNEGQWENYGKRGIKVCDAWLQFENFLADMGEKPEGTSLDRIDVNGNYEPSNCRWANPKQQSLNKRCTVRVTYQGREMTLMEACEIAGTQYTRAHARLKAGHSLEWVLTP
jgi:hypothetical protein